MKNIEEFGEDSELNEDADLEIKEGGGSNPGSKRSVDGRASVAPSQAGGHNDGSGRASM